MLPSRWSSVLILGAFVAFLPPIPPVSAEGHAQRICREEGISLNSEVHKNCLSQTIGALERGELQLARGFARVAVDPQEACLRSGLQPGRRTSAPALTESRTAAVSSFRARIDARAGFNSSGDFGLWLEPETHQPGKTLP